MVVSTPAFTMGIGFTVITIESAAAAHGPAPSGSLVVIVSVAVPLVMSFAPGVYSALGSAALSNVPSPFVVHVIDDAPPPKAPASVYVDPSQIVVSTSALTVASVLIVSVMLSVAAGHGPGGSSVVMVSVTVPLVMSVLPGV